MNFNDQEPNSNLKNELFPTIKQTSILFSMIVLFMILFSNVLVTESFATNIVISQIFIILLPPIILIKVLKFNVKKTLRLHRVSIKNLILSLSLLIFSYPLIMVINTIFILISKQNLNEFQAPYIPAAQNPPQLLFFIFIIGLLPGICEEVLMRGFILKGFENLGVKWALLLSSALFGLMHIDFLRIFPTFLLGLIIAFTVYRTNSLFTGMFLHFFNNSVATIFLFWISKVTPMLEEQIPTPKDNPIDFSVFPQDEKIILISFFSIFFLITIAFTLIILMSLFKTFIKNTNLILQQQPVPEKKALSPSLLWLIPGILFLFRQTIFPFLHS
jgi:uncharacterized protein